MLALLIEDHREVISILMFNDDEREVMEAFINEVREIKDPSDPEGPPTYGVTIATVDTSRTEVLEFLREKAKGWTKLWPRP